jgi:DNA helicase HerA-like ATPase
VASACGLFEIIIRLFVRADVGSGKVLVVDEAHKYLSPERHSTGLTNALLNLIRQQRHLAMRVIISTQEPTVVPPVLLDLCSVAVLHRFSSPKWWQHLIQHVPTDFSNSDAFDKVVKLQTGHSIVLAPSGIGLFKVSEPDVDVNQQCGAKEITRFGRRYLVMKTRKRVTADGGASVLVLNP